MERLLIPGREFPCQVGAFLFTLIMTGVDHKRDDAAFF